MPNFYIEQDIPIPRKRTGGRPRKYPALYTMEIGESFVAPNKTNSSMANTLRCVRPRKFVVRSVVEHRTNGVRIWRVE